MDADSLEFYKELYEKELNRKEEINSKISNYITLLTIMGTIIVFSIKNFVGTYLEIPIIIISIIIFAVNVIIFWIANHNKRYQYFDEAETLNQQFILIDDFYDKEGAIYITENETKELLSQNEKNRQLRNFYIKYGSENKKINDRRVTWNLYFIKSITISLCLISIMGISAIFFEKPININIENKDYKFQEKEECRMSEKERESNEKPNLRPKPPELTLNKPLYESFSKDPSGTEKRKK